MSSNSFNKRSKPVFKTGAINDQKNFKPLPSPAGSFPYHLNIPEKTASQPPSKMVFQVCGDTGGIVLPTYQHQVVREMTRQFDVERLEDKPLFFFHLGDLVYNFGQAEEYYPQFFEPFKNYPAPVFAIPGNHDGDVDPLDPVKPPPLDAFMKVFCQNESGAISFAGDTGFKSNIQPNVYFTLNTPLATIISLYSNTPKFGTIEADQKSWFIDELKNAALKRKEKAVMVCLHHSAYSADTNHGSSLQMINFLNSSFSDAGVIPDLVLSGHVHNYQRFSKHYSSGDVLPFVVAGAGGYAQLHAIAQPGDPAFPDTDSLLNDVLLEKYCDNRHGFLKITIQKNKGEFKLLGDYYTIPETGNEKQALLFDSFEIDLKQ